MNWKQVKQQWPSVEAVVRRTWGRIDEADLTMIHGERDSFTRVLAQRYGYVEAVAEQKVDAFVEGLQPEKSRRMSLTHLFHLLKDYWGHVQALSRR